MAFSKEFKESLIAKVLTEPRRSIRSVAREAQVGISSLHKWVHDSQNLSNGTFATPNPKVNRPEDWSAKQRFEAVIASETMTNEELNQYCRQQGLYKAQLERWKLDFMTDKASTLSKQQASELKALRAQNKQLQRELHRKEKALAEVSALLVLKKKADLIWPVTEDDSSA